jgi:hypothetical protein
VTTLPTITTAEHLVPTLKIWERKLNAGLSAQPAPRMVVNLRADGGAVGSTGITLTWESVPGADGYQLQSAGSYPSLFGDFSNAPIIATIAATGATSWVDHTGITTVTRFYRIRATAGTANQPQSVPGPWSAPVKQTSGANNIVYDKTSYSWMRAQRVR